MRTRRMSCSFAATLAFLAVTITGMGQTIIGDFEADQTKWGIPDWALEKAEYVGKTSSLSEEVAKDGRRSLKVDAAFTGRKSWEAAYVELEQALNLVSSNRLAVDVYLPKNAPAGMTAQFCLSVGDDYTWAEQLNPVALTPGTWTTIEVNIAPKSAEWKKIRVDENFRMGIQKVGVRVASNKKATYSGPIFIDNVRGIDLSTESESAARQDDGKRMIL